MQSRSLDFEKNAAAAGLSINGSKTQLMIVGSPYSDSSITVDGEHLLASSSVPFLGIELDCNLSPAPYIDVLIRDCRRRLNMLTMIKSRMLVQQLIPVVQGLLFGKAQVLLGHCFLVRLKDTDPVCGRARRLQVVLNDAVRLVRNSPRSERMPLKDLWGDVNLPTVNNIVTREAAMTAWRALSPNSNGSPSVN